MQTLVDSWAASADAASPMGVHLHVESLASGFGENLAQQRAAAGGWLQTLLQWAATPEGEHMVLNAVSTFVRQVRPLEPLSSPSGFWTSALGMLSLDLHWFSLLWQVMNFESKLLLGNISQSADSQPRLSCA